MIALGRPAASATSIPDPQTSRRRHPDILLKSTAILSVLRDELAIISASLNYPPRTSQNPTQGWTRSKGPLDWRRLTKVASLQGKALQVALLIRFETDVSGQRGITLSGSRLQQLGVDRYAGRRALAALEEAGIIDVKRSSGKKNRVIRGPKVTLENHSRGDPFRTEHPIACKQQVMGLVIDLNDENAVCGRDA